MTPLKIDIGWKDLDEYACFHLLNADIQSVAAACRSWQSGGSGLPCISVASFAGTLIGIEDDMASNSQGVRTKLVSLFLEQRLPWRLSQWLDRQKQEAARRHYDRKVLSTRPFVTGEDCPHFEMHTLLGHKHVGMTLWCVKSFLHYSGRKYIVVLHDDGSLTERDVETLKKHLVNVKVVRRTDADALIREKIKHLPNCCDYRFSPKETSDHRGVKYNMHIFALRLFDFNLLSAATKTLVLDADILFFKKPQEIIEWAEDPEDRNSLYSIEQYIPQRNARYEVIGFERKVPPPTAANAGLLCFDKRGYDLGLIEDWIGRNREKMDKYATFEQSTYNHLVQTRGGSVPLPDSYSFNYTDQTVTATHFAIKHLFFRNLPRLEKVLG
jgi:hypothetical protein